MSEIIYAVMLAALFFWGWFVVGRLISIFAGLTIYAPSNIGPVASVTQWGYARVNGIPFYGCMRVGVYSGGYLLETHRFFGGGKLWLDRDSMTVEFFEPKRLLAIPARKEICSGSKRIVLHGPLAEAVI